MLVLFSASDHNTAFLQKANMEAAVTNGKNLALVVQGVASIAAATSEVNRIADDYGQRDSHWDWSSWSKVSLMMMHGLCWPRPSPGHWTSGCATGSSPRPGVTRWRCWSCRVG
jgi:hypothetical protein